MMLWDEGFSQRLKAGTCIEDRYGARVKGGGGRRESLMEEKFYGFMEYCRQISTYEIGSKVFFYEFKITITYCII